jgi:hypothetical protein
MFLTGKDFDRLGNHSPVRVFAGAHISLFRITGRTGLKICVLHRLGRIPRTGDQVTVPLLQSSFDDEPPSPATTRIEVLDLAHHVPRTVRITLDSEVTSR